MREPYARVYAEIDRMSGDDLYARAEALASTYLAQGVTFDHAGEERPFPLDIVPRVVGADEWDIISPGVAQRVKTLEAFLADFPDAADVVVKPCVGAGSRDAQRHGRDRRAAMLAHVDRLLGAGRDVLLQPYLERVDAAGETALIHFDGSFSHAIRKGPLLRRGDGPTAELFATEDIAPRVATAAERALASSALAAIPFAQPLAYARVDLIHDGDGTPRLLELELAEPSLFFAHAAGSARRFAEAVLARLAA